MKNNASRIIDKEQKRNLIIDVAAKLFSEYGFHEVNMEMVAKRAEVAKGTIYNYFKSKDDLYSAINETRLSKLISELEKKFREEENVLDDLRGFVIHVFMFLLKYKDFFLIFQRTRLKKQQFNSKTLEEKIQRLKNLLINILQEGLDKNVFKEMNICFTADIILGMIYSAVLRNINRDIHDENVVVEREELFKMVRDSVLARLLQKPQLNGKTILLTRSLGQLNDEAGRLMKLGAEVISLPTLKIVPPSSWIKCDEAIKNFNLFEYVIFTSQNAIEWFLKRLDLLEKRNELYSKKIIAIGTKTTEKLMSLGFSVFFRPEKFNSKFLTAELKNLLKAGDRVLLPKSEIAQETIEKELIKSGIYVQSVPVYNVDIPDLEDIVDQIKLINEKEIDVYVFSSPSTFNNFLKLMRIENPELFFKEKTIAVIGPTTKNYIEKFGIKVQIEPIQSTYDSLIESIIKYFQ